MKKSIFLSLIIFIIIGSCIQEKKSPIEGSWELLFGRVTTPDTVINYPLTDKGHHMKIIGSKYYSTIWQDIKIDKSIWLSAGFNGGTYTFENGIYTEAHTYRSGISNIGSKSVFKAEIINDTLVLTNPSDKGFTSIEKWKRLE